MMRPSSDDPHRCSTSAACATVSVQELVDDLYRAPAAEGPRRERLQRSERARASRRDDLRQARSAERRASSLLTALATLTTALREARAAVRAGRPDGHAQPRPTTVALPLAPAPRRVDLTGLLEQGDREPAPGAGAAGDGSHAVAGAALFSLGWSALLLAFGHLQTAAGFAVAGGAAAWSTLLLRQLRG